MTSLSSTLNDFFADWTLEDAEIALANDRQMLAEVDAALANIETNGDNRSVSCFAPQRARQGKR